MMKEPIQKVQTMTDAYTNDINVIISILKDGASMKRNPQECCIHALEEALKTRDRIE